ncbi:ADP-ribosylation factor-like protein 5B [Symbiodinium microadriaticum]|uniref:ADP-ribosylation factor-like protein 5B n=1 Tax=Symbiodinium microadriaticum TaxID=2951 RepID=A0A1Q9DSQ5_SYMMI|nr:ADP-ribosylation factor-like protein 5B [Symbiodinium microadriaticum]
MGIWVAGQDFSMIVIVGLNNAGKTTILYNLHLGQVEEVKHENLTFQESLRANWSTYFEEADAIIFVVDSNDQENMVLAKMELFNVVLHEERSTISNFLNMEPGHCFLQDGVRLRCALLKLLGKDIQGSRNAGQIAQDLSLHKILTHEWQATAILSTAIFQAKCSVNAYRFTGLNVRGMIRILSKLTLRSQCLDHSSGRWKLTATDAMNACGVDLREREDRSDRVEDLSQPSSSRSSDSNYLDQESKVRRPIRPPRPALLGRAPEEPRHPGSLRADVAEEHVSISLRGNWGSKAPKAQLQPETWGKRQADSRAKGVVGALSNVVQEQLQMK